MAKKYGWNKQKFDIRDLQLDMSHFKHVTFFPSSVDMRSAFPACYDQSDLGSCTANAIAGLFQKILLKLKHGNYTPSRLFIYYNERVLENTVNEDAGADIRSGMKVVNKLGAPHEKLWLYDITKFKDKPTEETYKDGLKHKSAKYYAIDNTNLNLVLTCLAAGNPIVAGFQVYTSFESDLVARTGVVQMPNPKEKVLGGHAVLIVGYDLVRKMFLCRNSWGADWGEKGHFWIPFNYFTNPNLASDFWTAEWIA